MRQPTSQTTKDRLSIPEDDHVSDSTSYAPTTRLALLTHDLPRPRPATHYRHLRQTAPDPSASPQNRRASDPST
ncbi:hypothetical protein HYQ46_005056 [Verticillium longisporum]|nr:hypothetical protein HYQ46_005056 [Verticillium longisporum]